MVLGSAPDVINGRAWQKDRFAAIVAINNAWRVREDWDYLVHPDDFPAERRPDVLAPGQSIIRSDQYVPANNRFGGIVYAGATMAFTAGYWALAALKPDVLAFLGCDMLYPARGPTHFYGTGAADPLRQDVSIRSLEAKSARLLLHAARQRCACVRLSTGDSRLVFPKVDVENLTEARVDSLNWDQRLFNLATSKERWLGYYVASGRYWEQRKDFDSDQLDAVDDLWMRAWAAISEGVAASQKSG